MLPNLFRVLSSCAMPLWLLACNTLDSHDNQGPSPGSSTREFPRLDKSSKLDMLFVVDNSNSMWRRQAQLRAVFPHLLSVLASGDVDADGTPEHPPVTDLHLGVVSTDLGLSGGRFPIPACMGSDAGVLLHRGDHEVEGCAREFPRFLSFLAERTDVEQVASDLACIATLGTSGCGFEQPLEAALMALWPSTDPMPLPNGMNRVDFLADANGLPSRGHGDTTNLGFVRNDPDTGLSIIAVVVVSDEDDCSARTPQLFAPNSSTQDSPMRGINLRCPFSPDLLFTTQRYVEFLRALRPNNEHLVLFTALAGVPPETVDRDALAATDFDDRQARADFYARIREHPQMQLVVNDNGTESTVDDHVEAACASDNGKADPALRLVEVAEGFGKNGLVQSICADDFGPAADAIAALIARHLAEPE